MASTFSAMVGQSIMGSIMGSAILKLLEASGKQAAESIGGNMSDYELIGEYDDDDEFEGAIGADYDIVGEDDDLLDLLAEDGVSGAGDMEIIGASKKTRRAALRRKLAARNASVVRRKNLRSRRRNPLGLVPTTIAAGATVQVPSAPQNLFRPERLVVPSDIAFDFGIADIKVGNISQLVQAAELPAAIFSEVAIDTQVYWDTAEVGNQVSVNARNKSAGDIEFTAALLGTIAKR